MLINWSFISMLEGGRRLVGYVPAAPESVRESVRERERESERESMSGVTIATGVDLGQRTAAGIEAWPIPDGLKAKLKPYAGLKGEAAREALGARPLHLTSGEAEAVDEAVRGPVVRRLCRDYDTAVDADDGRRPFQALPEAAQTVIASVAFQYGDDLKARTPRFWALVTAQDWPAAVNELEHFGDAYHGRRMREAELLKTVYS